MAYIKPINRLIKEEERDRGTAAARRKNLRAIDYRTPVQHYSIVTSVKQGKNLVIMMSRMTSSSVLNHRPLKQQYNKSLSVCACVCACECVCVCVVVVEIQTRLGSKTKHSSECFPDMSSLVYINIISIGQ